MSFRRTAILIAKSFTSAPPRIKGLGIALAWVANFFRRWDVDVETTVFGNRMRLNSSDYLSNIVLFTPNYYDREERAYVRRIVRKGDYVVDVGANIGIYTLILADLVTSTGKVTAIEAEQCNAARLRHNILLNAMSWVTVHQCGVSDRDEELSLQLDNNGNAGAHSFRERVDKAIAAEQRVSCVPLSKLLDHDREPSFLKMDIEGFEHRVLSQYFNDFPKEKWPRHIMLEDVPSLREADAVAVVVGAGYRLLDRIDFNVFLVKE